MTNAAVYLRISLDSTGEHLAVDRQREDCRRIATERGWTITQEYIDNSISASKRATKRPAYDRMVADHAAGRFGALVCWDLDRLTRQPRQLEDWIDAAEDHGLLLTTANGEADLSTDGGRLFARIKASVARAEVERKSARQKRAAAQRADLGKPPSGARLRGYTDEGKVLADEAIVVRSIFTRFIAGDSLRGITIWLTEQGVPTRYGKPWSPTAVRSILTNPRYAGRAVYRAKVTGKAGQWEAIVDEATFDGVQAKLSDPRRITNRVGTDRKHLGSGIYLCGVCSGPLRSHGRGGYHCPAGHITRMAERIDALVNGVIRARLARPDLADLLTPPNTDAAKALTVQIKGLRARLATIEADYDADLIDGRRYAVATEKVNAELTRAETTRARTAGGEGLGSVLTSPDPAAAFTSAPLGTQRAVLAALVTVTLLPAPRGHKFDPETVRIECRQSMRRDTPT
jgi:site-specific DNA recombinase